MKHNNHGLDKKYVTQNGFLQQQSGDYINTVLQNSFDEAPEHMLHASNMYGMNSEIQASSSGNNYTNVSN